MTGAGHERNRLLTGGGAVGEARMAQVMERGISWVRSRKLRDENCDFSSTAGPPGYVGDSPRRVCASYACLVSEEAAKPLNEQLEEIRAQLAWVRDYL